MMVKEGEWLSGKQIQKEIYKKTGKFVSLFHIGLVAKETGLFKETGLGFKSYNKKLVYYFKGD